jgi:uncharacterized RDD family membrane protein YckC
MSRPRLEQATLFELGGEEDELAATEPVEAPLELPLDLVPAATAQAAVAPPAGEPAPPRARALAAAVDLGAHALAAGVAVVGVSLLDVVVRGAQAPGFALLLLVFSLFYTVVPLAFWGRTAGMAAAGIACRGEDGQPLSFGEAALRWAGGVLSALLLGLPALPALAGRRSLADRLSGRAPVAD